MRAVCYFNDCSVPECPHQLLARWARSFASHGFDPIVLDESCARKHPRFDEIDAMIATFPTVNGATYERSCWMRWLAYKVCAPAFFTDIDVINYGFTPKDVDTRFPMSSHYTQASPAVVYATDVGLEYFIANFPNAPIWVMSHMGRPHVSDMILYQRCFAGQFTGHCVDCCYPNALKSPLVHFGNNCVPENWRFDKRYHAVDDFTAVRKRYELESIQKAQPSQNPSDSERPLQTVTK